MAEAEYKTFGGKGFVHEKDDIFTSRDDASRHANALRKKYKFIEDVKIESQGDGTYWVWWSQNR